ncbi:unnamed protein product [Clavelina lepadiformis]|uniref:Anaphase-promoting complex subunit 2 n=3 Tax=Clavelina lepadiformis TaxID=159417 RepID=A0ABP0F5I5_CLALP
MNWLPSDCQTLVEGMQDTGTLHLFEDLVLFFVRKNLQEKVIPQFLESFAKVSCVEMLDALENLYTSMGWFHNYVGNWHNATSLKLQMNQVLKSILKWNAHYRLEDSFSKLFACSFQFYVTANERNNYSFHEEGKSDRLLVEWKGFKQEIELSTLENLMERQFKPLVQHWLSELGLVEFFCDDTVMAVLEVEVDRYITKICGGNFEKRWMHSEGAELEHWSNSQVMPWLKLIFHHGFKKEVWTQKLHYILYRSYTKLRISEMLNIITDYPDSTPALHELKFCLQHTRQRPCLIESLKNDITNRVLHPGVSTQNIITVYIAAVKALRELDLSGVVMEMVLEPCTTYLTQREDSVRMIMQGLLWDDGSNDLAAELATTQEPEEVACWNERVTEKPEDWMPDPREADPNKVDKSTRTSDIVTLFIGMYGSKEKFIKEYQKLLSKRLLQTWYGEKSESSEIRNLELLKKRFGEEDMSKCGVMLKDISDSKRINTYINEEYYKKNSLQNNLNLRTMVVSSQFWPDIPNQEYELPEGITKSLELFNKGFENLKASRSLKWLSSVGMVDIELEFEDRQLEISVNPLQASIIYHFQDEDKWTLSELSDSLKIPPTILRRKMTFWLQQGVLKEIEPDNYVTIEKRPGTTSSNASAPAASGGGVVDASEHFVNLCDEEEDEEKANSDEEEEKKKKNEQVFWNYVQGMLKNLESLPLDRIHKMLQMFAMHDSDMQIEMAQLRQLLNDKVQKGLLVIEQGKYKLVRDNS